MNIIRRLLNPKPSQEEIWNRSPGYFLLDSEMKLVECCKFEEAITSIISRTSWSRITAMEICDRYHAARL